jgi:CheY-like chemotaxis protein
MRNIYAITSMLEAEGMNVTPAVNGIDAVNKAKVCKQIPDVILMDIMMPEMDGYEAMRQIRQIAGFETLPIIAITAKAMPGDKEKCIQSGASDYISKPVSAEKLFSMMRIWLFSDNS